MGTLSNQCFECISRTAIRDEAPASTGSSSLRPHEWIRLMEAFAFRKAPIAVEFGQLGETAAQILITLVVDAVEPVAETHLRPWAEDLQIYGLKQHEQDDIAERPPSSFPSCHGEA